MARVIQINIRTRKAAAPIQLALAALFIGLGFWLLPSQLRAEWVDPFAAPPGNQYTTTPIFPSGTAQTKQGSLTIGGTQQPRLFVGHGGGSSAACINNVCYSDLLDALADAGDTDYLPIYTSPPATPDIGVAVVHGNAAVFYSNCSPRPCGPTSPADVDIDDYIIHRSQSPLELLIDFIENRVCSNNPNLVCDTNNNCGDPPNTCLDLKMACSNNLATACTNNSQCPGGSCVSKGVLGYRLTIVFTMADHNPPIVNSQRTVDLFGGTANSASGGTAANLIVNTSAAAINRTNNQTVHGLTLDNNGPPTITITRMRISWTPPGSDPPLLVRNIVIGKVPPPFAPYATPAFVVDSPIFFPGSTNSLRVQAGETPSSFASWAVSARDSLGGGGALFSGIGYQINPPPDSFAGEFRGRFEIAGSAGDWYLYNQYFDQNGNRFLSQADVSLLEGYLLLTSASGLNDICLHGTGLQQCINEWADIKTLYGTAGPSRWAQYLNDVTKTYLQNTTTNEKVAVGGLDQDKDAEFVFNQAASKLVIGLPVSASTPHYLTCGDGACNGGEEPGSVDAAPQCRTDCGQCADTTPPGDVFNAVVKGYRNTVQLLWSEPTTADFSGTLILRRVAAYPSSNPTNCSAYAAGQTIGDGLVVAIVPACGGGPGGTCGYNDTAVVDNVTYYYELYAQDTGNNYALDNSAGTRGFSTTNPKAGDPPPIPIIVD